MAVEPLAVVGEVLLQAGVAVSHLAEAFAVAAVGGAELPLRGTGTADARRAIAANAARVVVEIAIGR